jgi:hypothetical protein
MTFKRIITLISSRSCLRIISTWIICIICIPTGLLSTIASPNSSPATQTRFTSTTQAPPLFSTATTSVLEKKVYLATVTKNALTSALQFTTPIPNRQEVPLYEKFELAFSITGSVATRLDFPYDPAPPPGIVGRTGITVEALFLPPKASKWSQAIIQPAFRYQSYQRLFKGEGESLYPEGEPTWLVRFAPQIDGTWQYKLRVQDASACPAGLIPCPNWIESKTGSFSAILPQTSSHGFIQVSQQDTRYFEFSDGTPFIGTGINTSFGATTQVESIFDTYQLNGVNFLRTWMSATGVYSLGFSSWDPWANSSLDFSTVFPGSDVASKIDSATTSPCIFQGFGEGARAVLKRGRSYTITVRAKLENVQGPRVSGRPYGLVVKLGGWPKEICGNPDNGLQTISPYWNSITGWKEFVTTFTLEKDFYIGEDGFLTVALENAANGLVFIDKISITEGTQGSNILIHGDINYHLYYDQASSWRWDYILDRAAERNIYLKLVILEKHDGIMSFIKPDGLFAQIPDDNFFYGVDPGNPGSPTKVRRLQEYFWRYLTARWGYSTAVHSWELMNEGDPFNGNHYDQAEDLGRTIRSIDPNRHLVTTSFWHSYPVREFWANPNYPNVDYADIHAYNSTTWLKAPDDILDPVVKQKCGSDQNCYLTEMRNDSVLYHTEHSLNTWMSNPGSPVVRGEAGITDLISDFNQDPDLIKDTQGIWLHKFLFSQVDPGALYELYWYTDVIRENRLYPIFKRFRDFMADVPINSGDFVDLQPTVTNPSLRVLGQKDLTYQRAILWIDNRAHTWRQVVNGETIAPISGTIQIGGFRPNTVLNVEWWNTCSGELPSTCTVGVLSRTTVLVDAIGNIVLNVENLVRDEAVKIGGSLP